MINHIGSIWRALKAVHTSYLPSSWWVAEQNILVLQRNKALIKLNTKITSRHLGKWSLLWWFYYNHFTCGIVSEVRNNAAFITELPTWSAALATVLLPTSHLFHEALSSGDALDELELQYWESGPPFSQPKPADTAQESQFTTNLMDVFFWSEIAPWKLSKGSLEVRICGWGWRGSHNRAPDHHCPGI